MLYNFSGDGSVSIGDGKNVEAPGKDRYIEAELVLLHLMPSDHLSILIDDRHLQKGLPVEHLRS